MEPFIPKQFPQELNNATVVEQYDYEIDSVPILDIGFWCVYFCFSVCYSVLLEGSSLQPSFVFISLSRLHP